jgi:hypothetical protein
VAGEELTRRFGELARRMARALGTTLTEMFRELKRGPEEP